MSRINSIAQIAGSTPRTKEFRTNLGPRNPRSKTQANTDTLADYLVTKLKSPEHRPAFLRFAWRLDEAFLHSTAETALSNARIPRAYFISCCKREIARRGL